MLELWSINVKVSLFCISLYSRAGIARGLTIQYYHINLGANSICIAIEYCDFCVKHIAHHVCGREP